jgi:hypothetical protein
MYDYNDPDRHNGSWSADHCCAADGLDDSTERFLLT